MTEKCKAIVYPKGAYSAFKPGGCSRNAVRDGFCKQHHPDAQAERDKIRQELFDHKIRMREAPYNRLQEAQARIRVLEDALCEVMDGVCGVTDDGHDLVGFGFTPERAQEIVNLVKGIKRP